MIRLRRRHREIRVNRKRAGWLHKKARPKVRRRKREKVLLGERQSLGQPGAAN